MHCGFKWVKYAGNKFPWCDFTSFSKQFSAALHHFRFRFLCTSHWNLVKLLQTQVWPLNFMNFSNVIFGGFLQYLPNVRWRRRLGLAAASLACLTWGWRTVGRWVKRWTRILSQLFLTIFSVFSIYAWIWHECFHGTWCRSNHLGFLGMKPAQEVLQNPILLICTLRSVNDVTEGIPPGSTHRCFLGDSFSDIFNES